MNRRDALKATTLLLGGALVACAPERRAPQAGALSADDRALVESIADTLLPTTAASPGARAAGAGAAIDLLLTDCYERPAQQTVVQGLAAFRATCRDRCSGDFTSQSRAERERLLGEIDVEARKVGDGHWFSLVRELSLRAYFSSEVGMTQALRYVRVPGRWTGCTPLAPGQPAWG